MSEHQTMDRRSVVAALLADCEDMLVISGLGGTTWDVAAAGDRPENFYLWGGMGLATSTGLGLALAQPQRRVLVITGDGEMLMGLGSLATVAAQAPPNLAIAVIDNERYGETGEQLTHTAGATDLALIARGAGIVDSTTVTTLDEIGRFTAKARRATQPLFAAIKVAPGNPPMVLPPRDGIALKYRFRRGLLGTD